MLKKWLENKKLLVLIVALILIAGTIMVLVVTQNSKRNQGNRETQVDVLEPDEVSKDDSTDVSDLWGETLETDKQDTTVSDKNDKTDETDKADKTDELDNSAPSDKPDDTKKPENDGGILKDDIIWGDIY